MASGLYLGGVQLPFVSSLRVYLPRGAYTTAEFAHLKSLMDPEQDPVSIDASELADSLNRVSLTQTHPLPTPDEDKVRVLTLPEGDVELYAPSQAVARSIAGSAELLTGHMEHLATLVLTQEQWAQEIEHATAAPALGMPLQTRQSTWGIPFSWFTLVYANDRMEVVEANGRILTVRIQVPLSIAAGRAERMLGMLAAMAPELDLFAELEDLGHWLAGFGDDGVVELDYGPVANRVHPDDSPADVHMGLQCLADGDFTGAAAAYRRLANRWMPIRQLARAN
ncbi:hypothetical protein ART_2474 [Arthrobacter sp. PAMC 25486]|uniref:hypothetical protein n=1 Tax=Arthrobacter sp. PAMC 25486 TaxID=1494608 RepID=UPI0005363E5A|nr:hypothetical protein [Arthrobacter sp. PAMC 25486]AIY02073.1 hypothetical protein ART_2474 [Arthrobacter sp. PAMC 25486]